MILIRQSLIATPAMDDATVFKPHLLYHVLHHFVVTMGVYANGRVML